jgi:hypothetical protein
VKEGCQLLGDASLVASVVNLGKVSRFVMKGIKEERGGGFLGAQRFGAWVGEEGAGMK